jgi:hypothetical protein
VDKPNSQEKKNEAVLRGLALNKNEAVLRGLALNI